MQNIEFNYYINSLIDRELKSKRYKINAEVFNEYLNLQIGANININFCDIEFKKYMCGNDEAKLTFGLKKSRDTIGNFFFYFIENIELIELLLCEKKNIDVHSIQSIQRVLTGILKGYECLISLDGIFKTLVRRHFHQYLIWVRSNLKRNKLVYDEKVFEKRFILQTADTEPNILAIRQIEYGAVINEDSKRWGLKLKDTQFLMSDIILEYLSEEVYSIVISDKNVNIPYEEYVQMCYLLYGLVKGYELE